MTAIEYRITPAHPGRHLFCVQMQFATDGQSQFTLSLPAWLPGSYMIRDFAKHIGCLTVENEQGEALPVNKLDKQTWQVMASSSTVIVQYQVYAFDLSVRTAYLDNERGFFNGSSVFLQVKEIPDAPCTLAIDAPAHADNWRVATGLPRAEGTNKYAFGRFMAENYQQLIDCPVELGDFDVTEFIVNGIPHHLVFAGVHYGDKVRLVNDVRKLCQHHIDLFGSTPFTEYWFLTNLVGDGFGGLEHKNSTALQASRFDLPNPNQPEKLTDGYKTFLSLCSHEYFHAWNVCRIKPREFLPYNLQQEVYTRQLWAFEGITSYYDDFSLYRTGIVSFDEYLALLSKTATRVYRGAGELKQSVSDSSFDAWTRFYQQGPDAVNNIVSYYTKGSLIALWLDLTIRKHSEGRHSLDDLMRALWQQYQQQGEAYTGTDEAQFIEFASQLSGQELDKPLQALLNNADRVDLNELLADFGVEFSRQRFKALNSLETTDKSFYVPYLGAMYRSVSQGLKITSVVEESPAEQAGLQVNDVVIAIDAMKMTAKSIQCLLDHLPEQAKVRCHYFRDDKLCDTLLTITDSPLAGISLRVADKVAVRHWQNIIAQETS